MNAVAKQDSQTHARDVQAVSTPSPAAPSVDAALPPGQPGRSSLRRVAMLVLGIGVGLAAAAWGVRTWTHSLAYEETDDAFIEGHVVQLSPKVSAHVVKVYFDDNFEVKAGQRLLDLDPRDFDVARIQAEANVAAARGRLSQAEAQVNVATAGAAQARADVEGAVAGAENAHADLSRDQDLTKTRVIDRRELDNAVERDKSTAAALSSARQKVVAADAQITLADAQVAAARAEVAQREAMLRQAELNLSYCAVDAPSDGRVTRKNVEEGNYVQPGQTLLAVVPHDVWVVANFKETQLAHMQADQPVEISVDTFSGHPLRGHVDSFQNGTGARFSLLPPENATGNYVKVVQRVPVKIVFDEPASILARLAPGMSVVPAVKVH